MLTRFTIYGPSNWSCSFTVLQGQLYLDGWYYDPEAYRVKYYVRNVLIFEVSRWVLEEHGQEALDEAKRMILQRGIATTKERSSSDSKKSR